MLGDVVKTLCAPSLTGGRKKEWKSTSFSNYNRCPFDLDFDGVYESDRGYDPVHRLRLQSVSQLLVLSCSQLDEKISTTFEVDPEARLGGRFRNH